MEENKKLRVINLGLPFFYDALVSQGVTALQIDWRPPVKQSEEMRGLLDMFL